MRSALLLFYGLFIGILLGLAVAGWREDVHMDKYARTGLMAHNETLYYVLPSGWTASVCVEDVK